MENVGTEDRLVVTPPPQSGQNTFGCLLGTNQQDNATDQANARTQPSKESMTRRKQTRRNINGDGCLGATHFNSRITAEPNNLVKY